MERTQQAIRSQGRVGPELAPFCTDATAHSGQHNMVERYSWDRNSDDEWFELETINR